MTARVVLLALALLLQADSRADACSPPPDYGYAGVFPADGAVDLPTNVRIRVFHQRGLFVPELLDVVLRDATGADVPVSTVRLPAGTKSVIEAVTTAALAPGQVYEVLGRIEPGCGFDCITPDYVHYATFTTGLGPDVTPPVFGGLTGISTPQFRCCESDACCGPYVAGTYSLSWSDATDDVGLLAYHVWRDGTLVHAASGSTGNQQCDGVPYAVIPGELYGNGTFRVTAVDYAGNEDDNLVEVAVTVDCALAPWSGGPCDGGIGGEVDAGVGAIDASLPPDAAPAAEEDGGGCGCRTTGRSPAFAPLVLLLLLAMRRSTRELIS